MVDWSPLGLSGDTFFLGLDVADLIGALEASTALLPLQPILDDFVVENKVRKASLLIDTVHPSRRMLASSLESIETMDDGSGLLAFYPCNQHKKGNKDNTHEARGMLHQ
jgi:hypothetical protein